MFVKKDNLFEKILFRRDLFDLYHIIDTTNMSEMSVGLFVRFLFDMDVCT